MLTMMMMMMMMLLMVMMMMMSAATVLGSSVATENYPPGTFRGVFGWLEGVWGMVGFQTGEHSVVNFAQRGTDKTFLSNLHPLRCQSADGPSRAAVLHRSKSWINIIGV